MRAVVSMSSYLKYLVIIMYCLSGIGAAANGKLSAYYLRYLLLLAVRGKLHHS